MPVLQEKTSQNPASLAVCFDALFRLAGFYPLAHRHFDLYQGSALPQFYRDIWLPLPYWIRLTNSLWAFPLMIIGLYLCKLINLTKFLQGFVKISGALSLELYLVMIGLSYLGSFILKWLENKIQGQLLPLSRKK